MTRKDVAQALNWPLTKLELTLAWITSHAFRKTTATVLDNDGQTARQIADHLGHARVSMTQDTY
jgi:integrase